MKIAAYCSLVLFSFLSFHPQTEPNSSETSLFALPAESKEKSEPLDQLMFFAVSEGLYREGVGDDDVDIILTQAKGEGGQMAYVNFVYGCRLCTPSLNAFRNYRQRRLFVASKTHANSFGEGLSKDERAKLRSENPQERLDCLQGMIHRWVKARLDRKRLTDKEKQQYQDDLSRLRKSAMAFLKDPKSPYASKVKCAVCEGAVGSSK